MPRLQLDSVGAAVAWLRSRGVIRLVTDSRHLVSRISMEGSSIFF